MILPNKKTVPSHPEVILFLMEHKKRSKGCSCCSFPYRESMTCVSQDSISILQGDNIL